MSREFSLCFTTPAVLKWQIFAAHRGHSGISSSRKASSPFSTSPYDLQIRAQTKPSKPDLVGERKVCNPTKWGCTLRGLLFQKQGNNAVWISLGQQYGDSWHVLIQALQLWIKGPVLLQLLLLPKTSSSPLQNKFLFLLKDSHIWVKNAASSVVANILQRVFEINSKI